MAVLLVGYDLRKQGRDYKRLIELIQTYTHCHALGSMWFIDTNKKPGEVRDHLDTALDSNDQLYVIRLHHHWGASQKDECTDWLQDARRTWD